MGGLRFKSRVGQIGHSVATARHRCDISSKEAVLPGCNDTKVGPQLVARFDVIQSTMKDLP